MPSGRIFMSSLIYSSGRCLTVSMYGCIGDSLSSLAINFSSASIIRVFYASFGSVIPIMFLISFLNGLEICESLSTSVVNWVLPYRLAALKAWTSALVVMCFTNRLL